MATFHSVKDAVKVFDAGFSGGKHLNKRQQGVLMKETDLCFWNKEINKLKEKIKNAEKVKIEASLELQEAKKTVEHLNQKLSIKQNMRNEKALDLSNDVSVVNVTSQLAIAKESLRRVAEEESQLGFSQNMRNERGLDLSSNVRVVTSELGFAKESLQRVAEEESELCILMESLKLELQNVEKEHAQLTENEQREKDQAIEELKKEKEDSQLKENEQRERDQAVQKLNKEKEDAKTELMLLEEELKIAILEAEEAKVAEEHTRERLKVAETLVLQSGAEIKESGAELTETDALRACRDETLKKLEMSEKEIEDIKAATQNALKKAELAKEATVVVDAELKRRRKAASRILAETKMFAKSLPSTKEVNKSKPRSASKDTCLVKC